jgi:hypothetical protein
MLCKLFDHRLNVTPESQQSQAARKSTLAGLLVLLPPCVSFGQLMQDAHVHQALAVLESQRHVRSLIVRLSSLGGRVPNDHDVGCP